jgi:hypothetical protein
MTKPAKEKNLPPYHELFELPEGETPDDFPPPPNFQAIKLWVKRFGPNGLEECPRPWLLSEVPDRASFFDMFGGGRYEVEGRTLEGRFYARRTFVLVGDPKPLVPKAPNETAQPQAAAPTIPGMGTTGDVFAMANGNPMALLFMVMMQNADRAEARADRQATQSIEMFKAMATMVGGQRQQTDPAVAQVFGSMTEIMKAKILESSTPAQPAAQPRSVEEEFKRAKDLLELARKMNPDEKPEKIVDIIKELLPLVPPQLIQGLVQPAANGTTAVVDALPLVTGGSVG